MKVVKDWPPNINDIVKRFGAVNSLAVFTYGDTIFAPGMGFLDTYLMTHEETHCKQQGGNPEAWYKKYLEDDNFRLLQETEAYSNQYQHFCRNKKDLARQKIFLNEIATTLSSPMYGNMISFEDAVKAITQMAYANS